MSVFLKRTPTLPVESLLASIDEKIDGRHVITLWPWAGGVMALLGKADAEGNVTPVTNVVGVTSAEALTKLLQP